MLRLLMVPGCHVEGFRCESRSVVVLSARGRRDGARCPDCSQLSATIHGTYRCRPADLPAFGRQVRLDLRLRRYVCINEACGRRTFAERLPMLIAPRSKRTRRLARAQTQVGVALGGEAGSRMTHRLRMPTSGDTLLRLVRAAPVAAAAVPTIVGVDDWALRKRKRYGTIIVDLERWRPLDLLPDREAGTLAAWLRGRPGIDLVARDRSAEYRRAITDGASSAIPGSRLLWQAASGSARVRVRRVRGRGVRTALRAPARSAIAAAGTLLPDAGQRGAAHDRAAKAARPTGRCSGAWPPRAASRRRRRRA
jgi:transposase